MSGVMFFIWIPSEPFQTEQRNKRVLLDRMDNVNEKLKNNGDETDVQSGAGGGESSSGSKVNFSPFKFSMKLNSCLLIEEISFSKYVRVHESGN